MFALQWTSTTGLHGTIFLLYFEDGNLNRISNLPYLNLILT
ncbi:hypothetical protein NIES2104_57730 [Leptolyngbya sp. NIES-2104]|nr:hypothetical protein NIES2104_57730 [Leptolyngbya sp. NIES-2104]